MTFEILWLHPVFGFFLFLFGLCVGSFLNVCIYRIPLNISIVKPRSYCPACGVAIPFNHNIPVLGWFLLRGRAPCCGVRIDARYWMIELFSGILFFALWRHCLHQPVFFVVMAVLTSSLIVASCIDMDHYIIPDRFTLGGCIAGLIAGALVPSLHHETTAWKGFTESLRGAFVGGIILWLVAQIGTRVFKKEAMGMGDVKLLAAIGSFLGWPSTIFIIGVSSLIGSVVGIAIVLSQQKGWGTRIPYGPFLALGTLVWIFGGDAWTANYIAHLHRAFTGAP